MSSFAPEWLSLREAADVRARCPEVARTLSAWFALRPSVRVVDLGSGTGANLRASASLLPPQQAWTLVDRDPALLSFARESLRRWADASEVTDGALRLSKGTAHISVEFKALDLAHDLAAALAGQPDLVTGSALFDLVSANAIRDLARMIGTQRAAFFAALTYNGIERWTPHRPADNQMTAAFHRHQLGDKGFGSAAGPTAPGHIADQFRLNGYTVIEGDSPWRLGGNDRMLIEELIRGHAMAALETKAVSEATVAAWVKIKRTAAVIGHTDTFAAPA